MNTNVKKQLFELTSIICKIESTYGVWAKKHGLSYNSLMVLYAMDIFDNCTQKAICDNFMLPKQTVNSILTDFKNKGYITLISSENNKREKIIVLTDKGKIYSDNILTKLSQTEENAMLKMGTKLCDQLVESNKRFADAFLHEVENE